MSKQNDGGPAFPRSFDADCDTVNDSRYPQNGMSLRDRIAIAAIQGMLANPDTTGTNKELSVSAYDVADAMIEARSK